MDNLSSVIAGYFCAISEFDFFASLGHHGVFFQKTERKYMLQKQLVHRLKKEIKTFYDFPKPGIAFKDLCSILKSPVLTQDVCQGLYHDLLPLKGKITHVACLESRGFIFGPIMATYLKVPMIPIRKPGKLPGELVSIDYKKEYGVDTITIQSDSFGKGDQVLIHDDLLATGGSAVAAAKLVYKCGAEIAGFSFIMELAELEGRKKLSQFSNHITSVVNFEKGE